MQQSAIMMNRLPAFCNPVAIHASAWDPSEAHLSIPLNIQLDGRIVPSASSPDGARVDSSHVVVLDGLFGEDERAQLWDTLISPSPALVHRAAPSPQAQNAGSAADTASGICADAESHGDRGSTMGLEHLPNMAPDVQQPLQAGAFEPGRALGCRLEADCNQSTSMCAEQQRNEGCATLTQPGALLQRQLSMPLLAECRDLQSHDPATTTCSGGQCLVSKREHDSISEVDGPPEDRWERRTADKAGLPGTWGLRPHMLDLLASGQLPAVVEVQTRLCCLFPDYIITHMPTDAIQGPSEQSAVDGSSDMPATSNSIDDAVGLNASDRGAQNPQQASMQARSGGNHANSSSGDAAFDSTCHRSADANGSCSPYHAADALPMPCEAADQAAESPRDAAPPPGHCSSVLGNAAVYGDTFQWHVDADPSDFPQPSPWTDEYGQYCNREPGQPLFVSLLLYLDPDWARDFAAETLFLDSETDVGFAVRPKPYRAILMDQDILHRVSAPSALAGDRPRYSLVWKLVFFPRKTGAPCSIARSEWGPAASIGSAARVQQVLRGIASKRKRADLSET